VIFDPNSRAVNYADVRITDNTRGAYPIEHIANAKVPCVGPHPSNVIFLTCDAFGVLPPVSRLTPAQAMYHFISGYTAKVAGTEEGVTDPEATFSACFGAPFLVWHPTKYAEMLADKLRTHGCPTWLVNTGWSGGGYGVGSRMKLRITRAIIDAIHSGSLKDVPTVEDPIFGLHVPVSCPGVPSEVLVPRNAWADKDAYVRAANKVSTLFRKNFEKYADRASAEVLAAAPRGESVAGVTLKEEG
jgi:phosphoenolpyruvate carboxykinase (ATP)